jgi:hypothetical protein
MNPWVESNSLESGGDDIFEIVDCVNGKYAFKSTMNDSFISFQMFGIKLSSSLKESEQFDIYKI